MLTGDWLMGVADILLAMFTAYIFFFYFNIFFEKKKRGIRVLIEPLPDKRTVKKYKVFLVSSHMCCWPLFMRQDRVCAFPLGSTHPDYAAPV